MRAALLALCAACAADSHASLPGGPACAAGETRCFGGTFYICGGGQLRPEPMCTACNEHLGGCTACAPGTAVCRDGYSYVCNANGSGFESYYCDPVQAVGCDIDSGTCVGACAPQNIGQSYIGCDYYPTITGNTVNAMFQFAVAIANASTESAHVTIEWGALDAAMELDVAPQSVAVQKLPWLVDLKGCIEDAVQCSISPRSALVPKGAYHLRSTRPVTVYQFSPLDYQSGDVYSYTNDASLLLPANALGRSYVVAAWPAIHMGGSTPGLLAVTATRDGTQVTITPRAPTDAGNQVAAFASGQPRAVVLNQGDVVQLFNFDGDLTGSVVEADQAVQVIGGHFCADAPVDVKYCDHLEESMFPIETLGARYVVAAPVMPTMPDGKPRIVRIVAAHEDTQLTFDPPQAAPTTLTHIGDFVELSGILEAFTVTADHRILVAQIMEGQDAGGDAGDPALTLAAPVEQFRRQYLFHAPTNYSTNYVEVTAPMGAALVLDGLPVSAAPQPVGAGMLGVLRVVLDGGPPGDGNHEIHSDQPFGIQVYGYGQYTSYWYPGGLDLTRIVVP